MWIMTTTGVLSVVHRPSKTIDRDDERVLQVRARDRKSLTELRKLIPDSELGPVMATPRRDYAYRFYVTPFGLATATARMIGRIDYDNFKYAVPDDELHNLYLRIWSAVYTHYTKRTKRGHK